MGSMNISGEGASKDGALGLTADTNWGLLEHKPLTQPLVPEAVGGLAAAGSAEDPRVMHIDERTGRAIIQTGVNRDGAPAVNFAPVSPGDVIVPYLAN